MLPVVPFKPITLLFAGCSMTSDAAFEQQSGWFDHRIRYSGRRIKIPRKWRVWQRTFCEPRGNPVMVFSSYARHRPFLCAADFVTDEAATHRLGVRWSATAEDARHTHRRRPACWCRFAARRAHVDAGALSSRSYAFDVPFRCSAQT